MTPPPAILLLSTADWDAPLWTNKQHVARELAGRGHPLIYVESLGLRPPRPGARDRSRILRRLARSLRPPREVEPGLWVCSPLVLPWHARPWVAALNRRLLAFAIGRACHAAKVRPEWLWTYSPLTTRVMDTTPFARVIHHAVDDIAAQPGMPSALIEAAEAELAEVADVIFITAPALQAKLAPLNPHTTLLHNAADFDHFHQAMTLPPPADIAAIPAPRIGFVGAIDGYKVDLDLFAAVAGLRPTYSFVLIGPVAPGDPETDVAPLLAAPNVHLLGPRAYAELPACLAGMDVALLPLKLNRYTRSVFPMKLFEYLAAGRPVVSTPLPALEAFADIVLTADGPEAFAAAIDRALAGGGPPLERRLAAAREHTYARRTDRMLQIIAALPPRPQ